MAGGEKGYGGLRIVAPVDRVEEVAAVARAGAAEVYGGVMAPGRGAGAPSATRRTFASAHLADEGRLREAVAEARRAGVGFHLTLNAVPYPPGAYPALLGLAERAAGWGAAGVIVADLGLLIRLAARDLPLVLTLSSVAGAFNRHAVGFYRRFGISRAVLPRHLTLGEQEALVRAHPEVGFEAFVLVGKCPNAEALCTFQHVSPSKRWPCEIPYRLTDPEGRPLAADHPLRRWHEAWRQADRRAGCGVCGIPDWARMGVRFLKVVGRGGPTADKVANVSVVAAFVRGDLGPGDGPATYRRRFGRPCHPLTCYVPERFQDREPEAGTTPIG